MDQSAIQRPVFTTTTHNERDEIDPINKPEDALNAYHRYNLDRSADAYLYDFLEDQCADDTLVLDIETTELIDTNTTPISQMVVSVAAVMLIEEPLLLTFWGDARTERGAPLRFLRHALDHARRIVAYNGHSFDLVVLAQGDEVRLAGWRAKLHDPYAILRIEYNCRFKLSVLLAKNGIEEKTASGAEAPAMWRRWLQTGDAQELSRLEAYNVQDVRVLAALVQLPSIAVPGAGWRTDAVQIK